MSVPGDFYAIDEHEGIVIDKRLGNRAFILGVEPWTSIAEQLSCTFGSGAQVILFGIGRSYGMSAAQEEKKAKSNENTLTADLLVRLGTFAGWGKIVTSQDSSSHLRIRVHRCVFCAGMKNLTDRQTPCFFPRGVISGFAEVLRGPNKTEESHCDSNYCEFLVSFTDQKD